MNKGSSPSPIAPVTLEDRSRRSTPAAWQSSRHPIKEGRRFPYGLRLFNQSSSYQRGPAPRPMPTPPGPMPIPTLGPPL
jgi:hypothetical protein